MVAVSWFELIFALVILQRLIELGIAKRNAACIRALGGFEVGAEHYRWIVLLHASFFASLLLEAVERGQLNATPALLPFTVFLLAQGLRIWCLRSLGRFWNTRIFILPGSDPVRRGPYRFLRHPNYTVVALELFSLPLAFGALYTALLFSLLNALVLRVRIRIEERSLSEVTGYAEAMGNRPRFLPFSKK
ncbi:MAG: isoprenylcysteine carboxylmethyltransferase family protein [Tumebacillaceae bacterium]